MSAKSEDSESNSHCTCEVANRNAALRKKHQLKGGFDCDFLEEPPKQLQTKCIICLCILKDPYLVNCCGVSFCHSCIEPIQTSNKPCPHCNVAFTTCIPDKRLQRSLNDMKVYCSHKEFGCEWVGELGKLAQHLNDQQESPGCLFSCIECSFCNEIFQRQNLQEHKAEKCPKRPYSCDYCNNYESTCNDVTTNHWPICPSRPVPCPNECGVYPERKTLDTHIDQDCPLAVIDCAFRYAGCHERIYRKDMADHVAANLAMHMSLQAISYHQELQTLQEQLKQQNEIIIRQKKELEECKQKLKLNEHVGILPLEFIVPKYSKLKETNTRWQSKPFYTHAHGYKLSLHVAPNGFGTAKGTHVSVFIYLMKGEFDEDLHWPLRAQMRIYLIDHEVASQVFAEDVFAFQSISFDNEKSDVSFARVINGEISSSGWGKGKFIPHSSVSPKYLKNDCLHFKIDHIKLC